MTNFFQKILDESSHKPNKIYVDKGSEFYSRSVKSWLQDNDVEMYLTHSKRKYVVAETLIKTSNKEIYKYMTSLTKKCLY